MMVDYMGSSGVKRIWTELASGVINWGRNWLRKSRQIQGFECGQLEKSLTVSSGCSQIIDPALFVSLGMSTRSSRTTSQALEDTLIHLGRITKSARWRGNVYFGHSGS